MDSLLRRGMFMLLACALSGVVSSRANAVPVPLFDFSVGEPALNSEGVGTNHIGNIFNSGQGFNIWKIGAYVAPNAPGAQDLQNGGLTTKPLDVYLFLTSTGAQIHTQTIPANTPVDSENFAYVLVSTPLSLLPNTQYTLTSDTAGAETNSTFYSREPNGGFMGTWAFSAAYVQNRFGAVNANPLLTTHPSSTLSTHKELMGANLLVYQGALPEPSSFSLAGLAAVSLFRVVRLKQRRNRTG